MKTKAQHQTKIFGLTFAAALLLFMVVQPAFAVTDYVYFMVNGDTTRTSVTQGETLSWAANCDVGAMLTWEIWVDLNQNSIIEPGSDILIATFDCVDGDTSSDGPPPDMNPIPDGWYITPPMTLGVAPAHYIFRARNHVDNSEAHRGLISIELQSPPNMFCGRVTIQGHSAPDPILTNIWIEAKDQENENQMWTALTDENGLYQLNIGPSGTGVQFQIQPLEIPGYIRPSEQIRIASGRIDSVNFAFGQPSDSLYGDLRDGFGILITASVTGHCSPRFPGPGNKDFVVENGVYRIYFGPNEYGFWNINLDPNGLVPNYMCPNGYEFDNSSVHTQRHDFTCLNSNAEIYARVTEFGDLPSHQYIVVAESPNLQSWTYSLSGIGNLNLVNLHISSLDQNNWNIHIMDQNNTYPIPPGYVLDGQDQYWNRHPGDTVALNFIAGKMVRDTVRLDPGDMPINWNNVWVNLFNEGKSFSGMPDNDGVYVIFADTGNYMMNINNNGYLANPNNRNLHLLADTSGGLGFTLNQAHCHVNGALLNVPTPIPGPLAIWAHTGENNNGYAAIANVDSISGTFSFRLCDGNWIIDPPQIPNLVAPSPYNLAINEWPDTMQSFNLVYSPLSIGNTEGSLPTKFSLNQNFPNPFNSQTIIDYTLAEASNITIDIFDILGRNVAILFNGPQQSGIHKITWDAGNQTSGIYFCRVKAGELTEMKKMILLK